MVYKKMLEEIDQMIAKRQAELDRALETKEALLDKVLEDGDEVERLWAIEIRLTELLPEDEAIKVRAACETERAAMGRDW